MILGIIAAPQFVRAQGPAINPNGIVNSASQQAGSVASLGELVSIQGTNLAISTVAASSSPLPTTLGGTSVTINGVAAPLVLVSPTQINLQIPWTLTGSSWSLVVNSNGSLSTPFIITPAGATPGIFSTSGTGTGVGYITHADFSFVTDSSPARGGETVIILCTGLGAVSPTLASGATAPSGTLDVATTTPSVTIGGSTASVAFAGLMPGTIGYYRVDVVVPNLAGSLSVSISSGGVTSNTVSLSASLTPTPGLPASSVVNGASFHVGGTSSGVSPGAIVSVFGGNLSGSTASFASAPLSTTLNGTSVFINGVLAPLFYVSSSQVNAQIPYTVATGTGSVSVSVNGASSVQQSLNIVPAAPGLFTTTANGSGTVVAFHVNGSRVSANAPATPGEALTIFGTGFGALQSSVPAGTVSPGSPISTVTLPQLTLSGLPVAVTFAGTAPGFVGIDQVNFQIPAGQPTASAASIQAHVNGLVSNSVSLPTLASGGTLSTSPLVALPGATASVPVVLTLGSGVSIDTLSFTLSVTPGTGSPALSAPLNFVADPSMPAATLNASGNSITISWTGLSPAPTGTVALGNLRVPIAATAGGHTYTVQISSSSGSFVGSSLSILAGSSTTLGITGAFVTMSGGNGTAGNTAGIPVTITSVGSGVSFDSIAFGIRVDPGRGAPALTGSLNFNNQFRAAPTITDNGAGSNIISVAYLNLNPAISAFTLLGYVQIPIPANAPSTSVYTASLTGVTASLASAPVLLSTGTAGPVSLTTFYHAGDSFPHTADVAGLFGDNLIDTRDLLDALRAVTLIPGFIPATCTDRFDALDTYPTVGANNARGGDGVLNTLDLIQTLKMATGADNTTYFRFPRNACGVSTQTVHKPPVHTGPAAGAMWFGESIVSGRVMRVPMYLKSTRALDLAGLSFGVGSAGQLGSGQGGPLVFTAGDVGSPSVVDNDVPGALSVAWLNGFRASEAGNILVGYLTISGVDPQALPVLTFFGIDANARADGAAVSIVPRRDQ